MGSVQRLIDSIVDNVMPFVTLIILLPIIGLVFNIFLMVDDLSLMKLYLIGGIPCAIIALINYKIESETNNNIQQAASPIFQQVAPPKNLKTPH